jgi:signal transduction histidine kinase
MTSRKLNTAFAPAERVKPSVVRRQNKAVFDAALFKPVLDSLPNIILILNPQRQTVFVNNSVVTAAGERGADSLLGMRIGEILDCAHSGESDGGCGTTEFCRACGATRAILETQQGRPSIQEYRVLRHDGEALDLRVWASPLSLSGEPYTVFTLSDISDEKRRRALERVFFHDLLNSMSGVRGALELFSSADTEDQKRLLEIINEASERALNEINAQRQLAAAEANELVLNVAEVSAQGLLQELVSSCRMLPAARGKQVVLKPLKPDFNLTTDRLVLGRVITNMLKNAVEASTENERVTLSGQLIAGRARFSVHNPAVMPEEVRLQIFQRSFSTKGAGRGLGTYSIKLLTERYLKGKASFTSLEGKGTTFTIELPLAIEKVMKAGRIS